PILFIAPSLVAVIYAAGPCVAAVHADLARQTDYSQHKRQSEQTPRQKNQSKEQSKDASPNIIAAAPMKPVDTETGSTHFIAAIDCPAQYVSLHRAHDIASSTSLIAQHCLHRPIYQAHAPPSVLR